MIRAAVADEGRAVGAPGGVCAGEHDEVVGVEALGGELGEVERQRGAGTGERRWRWKRGRRSGRGHHEVDAAAAEDGAGIAGGEGEDVRAGDAVARRLERPLGHVDHHQAAQDASEPAAGDRKSTRLNSSH